ncbi:protein FAM83G-like isoform X1 [Phyllopteryx taeniolatus]|uniref:protein FAM83G-like isoform X1 n=1 Tax=Phyllopteryx taeniolatus TaxID=161469 RepID=UPI002AD3A692|nr:protein FAM83G-like isoform X1 [Phyllopteryx taeniolatus]
MALSQIQCLDDNNVNLRTNESKPEFFYSEDQRLALEVLLREGREAFAKFLEERHMRSFLSDLEQETLTKTLEPYDPGSELFPEDAEENEPPLSLHYWPELSDMSIPQMDLGWPYTDSYRGVTRTTVYTQPPLEGQTHIKEIVRRMIAQAQKVIAVVMDVFTDVDIFRDLIDAGFRRKVSVYILLESTTLPHFLSMCQRANMHAGHLKNLRVRCTEGTEFYTRSCTKVKGRLGHRFMLIDGDKAVSGSFSFTWMSSRLDKNIVTVVTGQAVEVFDDLFRHLYVSSRFVDLQQVTTEPEPEREPLPQLPPVALPSTTIARKLYNPKYALLIGESATPSADQESPKESQTPEVPDTKKRRRGRGSKEPVQEEDSIHPGLINLEKAYLIPYLPTWPEPDPPSDVIGFINIRDASKPTQMHLQRSERFETSQAIRFRNPLTMSTELIPEVAKPRETTSKIEKINPPPSQDWIKAKESIYDRLQHMESTSTKVELHSAATRPVNDATNVRNTEQRIHSVALTSQDEGQAMKHTPPLSSNIEHKKAPSKIEHPSEQRNRVVPKIGTCSSATTQDTYLPSPTDSNSGKEHTGTKTTSQLMQAKDAQSYNTSHSSPDSHTLDTSHPSSSSSSSSNTKILEPHTIHPANKDSNTSNGLGTPNISTLKRLNSLTREKVAIHKPIGENKQQTIPKMRENSNRKIEVHRDDRKSDSIQNSQQHKQRETSTESQNIKTVGLQDGKGRTPEVSGDKEIIQSSLATLAPNRDNVNISDEVKTVRPLVCDGSSKPQENLVATVETESKAISRKLTDPKSTKILNKTESEKKTYHVKENKPQRISYSQSSPLTMWERIQAAMKEPSTGDMDVTSKQLCGNTQNSTKNNTRRVAKENPKSPKEQAHSQTPEKAFQSAERELLLTTSVRRTSDGFLARTPTPDSPVLTPDFRTPTSDMSDGHRSRDDSSRSSASEEYFECSGSPNNEHVFEGALYCRHSTAGYRDPEDTQKRNPNAGATKPLLKDYSAYVALFDKDKNKHTSSKETQGLEKKVKTGDKEDVKTKDSGIKNTLNRDLKGKEGRNGEESKTPASLKTLEKENETQFQALMRKSQTQREAGSSNGKNRDGSAREVGGQKLNVTSTPSHPVSASVTKTEKKAA